MTINRVCISLLILVVSMTACNSQQAKNDRSKIDLETIDFDTPIDSLLTKSKFVYIPQSSNSNSLHYSFFLDSFCYNHITFEGMINDKFYQGKPEALNDVYNANEIVNRIDIYPSTNASIDAIVLTINEKDKAERLLKLLDISSDENFKTWSNTSRRKSYIIRRENWKIDDIEMITLIYSIVRLDKDSLFDKLKDS